MVRKNGNGLNLLESKYLKLLLLKYKYKSLLTLMKKKD